MVAHNGFRYRQYLTDVGVDTDVSLHDIVQWLRKSNCHDYGALVDVKFVEWFPTVSSKTLSLCADIRSTRFKPFTPIDRHTGDILL